MAYRPLTLTSMKMRPGRVPVAKAGLVVRLAKVSTGAPTAVKFHPVVSQMPAKASPPEVSMTAPLIAPPFIAQSLCD